MSLPRAGLLFPDKVGAREVPFHLMLDPRDLCVEPARLQAAYLEAIEWGYFWHEFGDMNLII